MNGGGFILVLITSTLILVSGQWTPVGTGVQYRKYGQGAGILVMYAGWSVSDTLSQHWAERIMQQSNVVSLLQQIGHVYAVRGPRDTDYHSAEISNSKLIKHLLALSIDHPRNLVVVAHSSGAFVANEFFSQFHGPNGDSSGKYGNKIIYFNLDGAGGLDAVSKSKVQQYYVYATHGRLQSKNANTMKALGTTGNLIELDGSDSGCLTGRCLHDFMINQHPWNPYSFDLEKDYGLFAVGSHEVQYYYLQWLSAKMST